jgi:hypothetical protein
MFLTAVSGGLVALGLVATASGIGSAFYAFALILLPTLAFVGLVTFERALQSGIEDLGYARRIALLRGFYFDNAPEVTAYLLTVPEAERVRVQGPGRRAMAGLSHSRRMVGVITCVLFRSTIGLAVAVAFDHDLTLSLVAGGAVALVALPALMRNSEGGLATRRGRTGFLRGERRLINCSFRTSADASLEIPTQK